MLENFHKKFTILYRDDDNHHLIKKEHRYPTMLSQSTNKSIHYLFFLIFTFFLTSVYL